MRHHQYKEDFNFIKEPEKFEGLTTMVLDFEDGISKKDLIEAENNVIDFLEFIYNKLDSGKIKSKDLPLFFIRVRNFKQFQKFSTRLNKKHIKILTGLEFPKFNTENGLNYLNHLKKINEKNI